MYQKELRNEEVYVYIEAYNPDKKLELNEGQGMGWYSYDELEGIDIAKYSLEILLDIKDNITNQTNP